MGDPSLLRELSVRARLPSALHHQRRAAALLAELRADHPGELDLTIGATTIDALDLLLSDIVQTGGATMALAALLATVPPGDDRRTVDVLAPMPELDRAARVARRHGVDVRVRSEAGTAAKLRARLYPMAKLARAVRASVTSTPVDAPMPEVLFVAQVPHHVGDLAPVARRVRDVDGRAVGFLVEDAATATAATDLGFAVVTPPRRHPAATARLLGEALTILRRFDRAARRAPRSIERDAFAAAVRAVVRNQLARGLLAVADADAVVRQAPVQAVVVANPYSRLGRAAGRVAEQAGVPVVAIEHGSVFPDDPRWAACPVTAICAWGASSRRALLASGIPADQVVVTGAPRFDDAPAVEPGSRRPDGHAPPGVLVATSGAGDHVGLDLHLRFIAVLAEAVRATPDLEWVIKLHPKDRRELYAEVAASANVTVVDGRGVDRGSIFDHLAASAVLVTVASTTAIDALRARVPVVAVWLTEDDPPEFIARTAAVIARSGDDLAAAVASAGALDPPDPDYLVEHFAAPGHATGNVGAVIERVIAGSRDADADAAPGSGAG